MKPLQTVGILLILAGLMLTSVMAITISNKQKAVEAGQIAPTDNPNHWYALGWTPLIGVVIIGVGAAICWKGSSK